MKRKLLPVLLLSLLLASCFKYINVDNSVKYTVEGVHDLTIDQNDSAMLAIGVQLLSGDPAKEYITLTVSGIPANVAINQDSLTFRPNYSLNFVFYGHAPKPGVYPISITMTSPTVGTKVYTFNLTVTSLTDCTPQFSYSQPYYTNNRHEVQIQGSSASSAYAYIYRTGCDTLKIEVMIDSMEPGSEPDGVQYPVATFKAFVDCSASALTIFPQAVTWQQQANTSVRGNGNYVPVTSTTATITINDTVFSGSQISSTKTFTIY